MSAEVMRVRKQVAGPKRIFIGRVLSGSGPDGGRHERAQVEGRRAYFLGVGRQHDADLSFDSMRTPSMPRQGGRGQKIYDRCGTLPALSVGDHERHDAAYV